MNRCWPPPCSRIWPARGQRCRWWPWWRRPLGGTAGAGLAANVLFFIRMPSGRNIRHRGGRHNGSTPGGSSAGVLPAYDQYAVQAFKPDIGLPIETVQAGRRPHRGPRCKLLACWLQRASAPPGAPPVALRRRQSALARASKLPHGAVALLLGAWRRPLRHTAAATRLGVDPGHSHGTQIHMVPVADVVSASGRT